jgi:RNA polymerase sigma factor (sigma-70 family)
MLAWRSILQYAKLVSMSSPSCRAIQQRKGRFLVNNLVSRLVATAKFREDAFQATFLVLARRAQAIRRRASLASWLYGVAYRLAMKARAATVRRSHHEKQVLPSPVQDSGADVTWGELRQVLDEELARLPEKLRAPLLLCYFDGQTQDEASRQPKINTETNCLLGVRVEVGSVP